MHKATLIYENYGFKCTYCQTEVKLGDLLPPADRNHEI